MPNDANQDKLQQARVGVIGGSESLYAIEGLTDVTEVGVKTPFGTPPMVSHRTLRLMWSFWRVTAGTITCSPAKFLPRQSLGHALPWGALADLSLRRRLLQEHLKPRDMVVPEQFIDRTMQQPASFFGKGCVAHVVQ